MMTEMIEIQKSNTNMKKILIVVSGFTFALIVVVTILSVILSISINQSPRHDVCTSKSCIKAANLILKNLDESIDPCDNFYQFSCGMFGNSHRIPDDQPKIDELSILRDKLAYSVAGKFEF